jgi:hypothetical protein
MGKFKKPRRKRRTREHVIEDLSENHLELKVLLQGHVQGRPERDYGVDVTMFHFADNGEIENGEVRFQLKATEKLKVIEKGKVISFPIRTGDLHYWAMEIHPFILVVFDVSRDNAFWLHIQEYVAECPDGVDPENEEVSVHIPMSNKLTRASIDHFRKISLQVIDILQNQGGFPNVKKGKEFPS